MRLHRIRLVNFRGVGDRTVEFDTEGVTVVVGDNEVGKSSIFDALHMVLEHLHSGTAKEVVDAKPADRDVGPEVEVELSTGEYRFTYRKRWLKNAETTLRISAPAPENITGREAHERVEQILADTLDKDLWAALRMLQSGSLELPGFAVKSLGEALDASAAGTRHDGEQDSLYDRAEEAYLEFWTKKGRAKKRLDDEKSNIDEARAERDKLQGQLDGVDSDQRDLEKTASRLDELRRQEADQEKGLERLTAEWDSTEDLRREVDRLAQEEKTAKAEMDNAKTAQAERRRLIEEAETAERNARNGNADLATAEKSSQDASDGVREAEEALESANGDIEEAKCRRQIAKADCEHHAMQKELEGMKAAREKAERAQQQMINAEAAINTCLNRDDAEGIAGAERAMEVAKAKLDQSTARVDIVALDSTTIEVGGEALLLEQGEKKTYPIEDGNLDVLLPEKVQITFQAGDDSKRLAEEFQAARDAYEACCSRGGVANAAEASRQATDRENAERERKEAEGILRDCLSGITIKALSVKIDTASKDIDSYVNSRTSDFPLPADAEEAEASAVEAEQEHEGQMAAVSDRERAVDSAKHKLATAEKELEQARRTLEEAETKAAEARNALSAARQSASDISIDGELATTRKRLEDLQASAGKARLDMESNDTEALRARLDIAEKSLRRTKFDIKSDEHEHIRLKSRLQQAGTQGLGTELAEAERTLELLERKARSTKLKADAVKWLYQSLDKHRQAVRDKHAEPFKQEVERLGRLVFGGDFEVGLDEDMAIVKRTLDMKTIRMDQLSIGAREQIGVLSRLACASITSPNGKGAPVVIDDALGWSDTARLQSMGQAIADAGRKCQVIILTCMPGRYSNVGNAKTVRL